MKFKALICTALTALLLACSPDNPQLRSWMHDEVVETETKSSAILLYSPYGSAQVSVYIGNVSYNGNNWPWAIFQRSSDNDCYGIALEYDSLVSSNHTIVGSPEADYMYAVDDGETFVAYGETFVAYGCPGGAITMTNWQRDNTLGKITMAGVDGNDLLICGGVECDIQGGLGNDLLVAKASNFYTSGSSGNDIHVGYQGGNGSFLDDLGDDCFDPSTSAFGYQGIYGSYGTDRTTAPSTWPSQSGIETYSIASCFY